jgi:ABC-type branched-subunit amino acid transport system substrate-binding protein
MFGFSDRGSTGTRISRRGVLLGAGATTAVAIGATTTLSAQETTRIKIGQIQALTGPSAAYGVRARDGAAMAAEAVNVAGGITVAGKKYQLEVLDGDIVNDPKQAITLFRQYALDNQVVAALGSTTSVGYVPLVPVSAQLGLPIISNGAGAPIKRWSPWAYRVNPVGKIAVPATLAVAAKVEKIKRLAVIYDQANDAQKHDAEICQQEASTIGYEVVAFEACRSGDQDFSPQIATIKKAAPDAVFVAAATGDGIKIVLQLRSSGVDKPLITGNGSFDDTVYWDGTRGGIKGGYTYVSRDLNSATDKLAEWLAQYKSKFSLPPNAFSLYGATSLWTVVEAIKQANSIDRKAVQAALSKLDFTDPLGSRVQFNNPPDGENLQPSLTVVRILGRGLYESVTA